MDMKKLREDSTAWALGEIEKFGSPPRVLFDSSLEKGILLAKQLGADPDIVFVGCTLMDVKLGEAVSQGTIPEHVDMGIKAVTEFLSGYNISDSAKQKIIDCVASHHGVPEFSCIEAEVCANADCYRFLLPKNLFTFVSYLQQESRGMTFEQAITLAKTKMDSKWNALTFPECKEEVSNFYYSFTALFDSILDED